MPEMQFYPAGDNALVIEFGSIIDEAINQKVHNLAALITASDIRGVTELLPTFRSLMVYYDASVVTYGKLKSILENLHPDTDTGMGSQKIIHLIPCCYGARFGVDLHDMEALTGLTREEIISIHSSVDYKIYMLGFLPGFVYLGGLDKRIEAPRLQTPRVKINPGSVGIGGNQTGVYPLASPGGWRLIGGTPVDFYDPDREDPILCKAGEYIRFVPITIDDYYDIRHSVIRKSYTPEVITEAGSAHDTNKGGSGL